MRFKQFLAEMPYIIPVDNIKCPQGDIIEPYDMSMEEIKFVSKGKKDAISQQVLQKSGIVPMYCKKHNRLFLYDYDTQKSWYAEDDKEKINMLLNGLYRHAIDRGGDKELAKKLKNIKLPWKKDPKVFKKK